MPIKPLESALRNMYEADVREAGAIRLECDGTSNPRHESEDCGATIRMLLSKVWQIYSNVDAQRRCLDKASVPQLRNITDILTSRDDARRQRGMPSRAAPSSTPHEAAALLAITNGEAADSVADERPRPSRSASARMGVPGRAGHSPGTRSERETSQRRGASRSRSPRRQRRGASPSRSPRRVLSTPPLQPPRQNPAKGNSPQVAWAFGGCVRLGSTAANHAIAMGSDVARVVTTQCVSFYCINEIYHSSC